MKNIFTITTIIWLASYTSSMGQCLEDNLSIAFPKFQTLEKL
jgi:hypothetical protein